MALFKYLFMAVFLILDLTQGQLLLKNKLSQQAQLPSIRLTATLLNEDTLISPPKNQSLLNDTSTLTSPTPISSSESQLKAKSDLEATSLSSGASPVNLPPIRRKLIRVEQYLIQNDWYSKA
jgi:hypothetical protein